MHIAGTFRASWKTRNNLLKPVAYNERRDPLCVVELWHATEEANLDLTQSSIKHI